MPTNRLSQYLNEAARRSHGRPHLDGFEAIALSSLPGWDTMNDETRTMYELAFRKAQLQSQRQTPSDRD